MGGSSQTPPTPPDWQSQYEAGAQTSLDFAPEFAAQEFELRNQYGPAYAELAGKLYGMLAPRLAHTNMKVLNKTDPQSLAMRDDLFQAVRDDLANGYALDPKMQEQLTAQIRGAQSARGNVLGPAPVAAEGLYLGDKALQLRQQRLSNASGFLAGWKPQDSFGALLGAAAPGAAGVITANTGADPTYTDPGAGWRGVQAGQAQYGQQLQAFGAAQGSESNPWMGALGGAASGATAGAAAGPYGAIIGALIGGGVGYASSS